MYSIALVEDEEVFRKQLQAYLSQFAKENALEIRVTVFTDGDEILENYRSEFDIILMDIQMRFVDGMTAAEKIRAVDQNVSIIFITSSPQYAIRGYTVGALDYILKPVSYYSFSQTMLRACRQRQAQKEHFLLVDVKNGRRRIAVSDIRYIEVINHDLIVHTKDEDIEAKGTIRQMCEELCDEHFFLCNKSYLVNLAFVDGLENNDIRIGRDIIQVSRSKKKSLLETLAAYYTTLGR